MISRIVRIVCFRLAFAVCLTPKAGARILEQLAKLGYLCGLRNCVAWYLRDVISLEDIEQVVTRHGDDRIERSIKGKLTAREDIVRKRCLTLLTRCAPARAFRYLAAEINYHHSIWVLPLLGALSSEEASQKLVTSLAEGYYGRPAHCRVACDALIKNGNPDLCVLDSLVELLFSDRTHIYAAEVLSHYEPTVFATHNQVKLLACLLRQATPQSLQLIAQLLKLDNELPSRYLMQEVKSEHAANVLCTIGWQPATPVGRAYLAIRRKEYQVAIKEDPSVLRDLVKLCIKPAFPNEREPILAALEATGNHFQREFLLLAIDEWASRGDWVYSGSAAKDLPPELECRDGQNFMNVVCQASKQWNSPLPPICSHYLITCQDERIENRVFAILRLVGGQESRDVLAELTGTRQTAALALGCLGDERALPFLKEMCLKEKWPTRQLSSIGIIGGYTNQSFLLRQLLRVTAVVLDETIKTTRPGMPTDVCAAVRIPQHIIGVLKAMPAKLSLEDLGPFQALFVRPNDSWSLEAIQGYSRDFTIAYEQHLRQMGSTAKIGSIEWQEKCPAIPSENTRTTDVCVALLQRLCGVVAYGKVRDDPTCDAFANCHQIARASKWYAEWLMDEVHQEVGYSCADVVCFKKGIDWRYFEFRQTVEDLLALEPACPLPLEVLAMISRLRGDPLWPTRRLPSGAARPKHMSLTAIHFDFADLQSQAFVLWNRRRNQTGNGA